MPLFRGRHTGMWLLALACSTLPIQAYGQLVQNLTIGNPKAISLGNAVTADPPGVDSIHYNPAGLTRLQDRQMLLKFIAADIELTGKFSSNDAYDQILEQSNETDPIANTTSDIDGVAFFMPGEGITEVPVTLAMTGGMSYSPPASRLTFASAVYAPVVGGYIRSEDDPGRFYGREAAVSRITYFSPTLAYRVSDTLSLGAGLGFSYFGIGIELDFRAPNPLLGIANNITQAACDSEENGFVFEGVPVDLCGGSLNPFESLLYLDVSMETPVSPTFNLGILWEPTPWLAIGALYQSESSDTLEGDINIDISDNVLGFTQGLADSNPALAGIIDSLELTRAHKYIRTTGQAEVTMPAHAALGMSLQLTPSIKFNVDWKWYDTSVWDEIHIEADRNIPLLGLLEQLGLSNVTENSLTIPRGYEDAANFAFGFEYQFSDRLALRFGYEPRDSGIPDNRLDFLIPIGDFDLYGLGFSYQRDKTTVIDMALAYGHSHQYIPAGSSTNGNALHADNVIYNPSAGMDVTSDIEFILLELSYQKAL